jgi:lipoate-protein ligase A
MNTIHPPDWIEPAWPRQTWRLIITPAAHGAWNMAVDEAMLDLVNQSERCATLRLYAWEPACLSLGYAQTARDADLTALERRGWTLVRRPTGGRAILHTDELTYSVIASHDEPRMQGSILESYRRIAQALLAALHQVGIAAQASALKQVPQGSDPKGPVCFEVPSNYEITWAGKKLIGSAQARRKEGVLQHGTLPLCGDLRRITQALVFADEAERSAAAERLQARSITAADCLGYPLDWNVAAQAFVRTFSEVLNLDLEPGELIRAELERADELMQQKYANAAWTFRT